jgi:hypothetical protein
MKRRRRQPEFTVEYRTLPPKNPRPSLQKNVRSQDSFLRSVPMDVQGSDNHTALRFRMSEPRTMEMSEPRTFPNGPPPCPNLASIGTRSTSRSRARRAFA